MYTSFQQISSQQIYTPNAFKDTSSSLGDLSVSSDNNIYAYAQAGAVNIAAGKINVTPAKITNHQNLVLDVTSNLAVGSTVLVADLAGSAVTAGFYNDGYLIVNDGTGVGQQMQIVSNSAQVSTTGPVTITLADGIAIALDGTTRVSLVQNPYSNQIVHPGGASTFFASGVAEFTVPATYYYWSKVRGSTSMLSDGIIAKGTGAVLTANAIPGATTTETAATVTQRVSIAPEATVDTKYYAQYLMLV
jgi:hypothetical protein